MGRLAERPRLARINRVSLFPVLALKHAEFVRLATFLAALMPTFLIGTGAALGGLTSYFGVVFTGRLRHKRTIGRPDEKSKGAHSPALAISFVEEDGGGVADVEGIDVIGHGNGDGFVAGV